MADHPGRGAGSMPLARRPALSRQRGGAAGRVHAASRVPPADQSAARAGFPRQSCRRRPPAGRDRAWIALSRQSDRQPRPVRDDGGRCRRLVSRRYSGATISNGLPASSSHGSARGRTSCARQRDGVLGPEAEVGLVGELDVLDSHARAGHAAATQPWRRGRGPSDGLQDFVLGTGAIEVKTTMSAPSGFPATHRIARSAGRLDCVSRSSWRQCGSTRSQPGTTLPERVERSARHCSAKTRRH